MRHERETAAILSTIWGTIVYFDASAGALRHKEMSFTETNCFLLPVAGTGHGAFVLPDVAGSGLLQFEVGGEGRLASDCLAEKAALEECFFFISTVGLDEISLLSRGRFLGCEPDGRISLSNTWRKDWEKFRIAEVPRSLLPSLERLRNHHDSLLRLARGQLHADSLMERSIVKGTNRPTAEGRRAIRALVICQLEWLEDYICFEHFHFIRHLHLEHGFDVLDTAGVELFDERTVAALNSYEIVLVAYQGHREIPLHRVSAFKILKIDDLESYDASYQSLVRSLARSSHMIVGPYAYEMPKFFAHPRIRWVPYSSAIVEEGGILPFNEHPVEKLLVSGALAWDRPFRQFVADLQDSRIHKLGHPGYESRYAPGSTQVVRGRWFREIHGYLCAFCDAHSLRYIHLRAFEIASVGTLLMADDLVEAEMKILGFVDGVTCIFCNKGNFVERLDWVLAPENRGAVDRIRRSGMELCLRRHLTARRADEFVDMVARDPEFATSYRFLADPPSGTAGTVA